MCIRDRTKRCCEETKESVKKIRRELIINNQMEVEEVPEDKNSEQVSPEPEERGEEKIQIIQETEEVKTVSYTHLDVYKRQGQDCV